VLVPVKDKHWRPLNSTTFILFHADWCGPCRMCKPFVEKISDRYDKKTFLVDVDTLPDITNSFKILSIPTLLKVKDGYEVKNRVIGFDMELIERAYNGVH
jgi:thiol-disulfide isomerase/thioredoxin